MCLISSTFLTGWEFAKRHPGTTLVLIGVAGEGCELWLKLWRNHLYEKYERKIEILGFVFWAIVVIGLAWEIPDASKSDMAAATMESNNLVLRTNVSSLDLAILRIAHQYDLSTNALAEANARLASVRPIKQRFLDWFKLFAPSVLSQLQSVPANARLLVKIKVGQPEYFQLASMIAEPGGVDFCAFGGPTQENIVGGGTITVETALWISPALIKQSTNNAAIVNKFYTNMRQSDTNRLK